MPAKASKLGCPAWPSGAGASLGTAGHPIKHILKPHAPPALPCHNNSRHARYAQSHRLMDRQEKQQTTASYVLRSWLPFVLAQCPCLPPLSTVPAYHPCSPSLPILCLLDVSLHHHSPHHASLPCILVLPRASEDSQRPSDVDPSRASKLILLYLIFSSLFIIFFIHPVCSC